MNIPERCLCAAPDCGICGPLQGYPVRRPRYGLSAEDCDMLNAEEETRLRWWLEEEAARQDDDEGDPEAA